MRNKTPEARGTMPGKTGFTLIELLIVVAIIAILAAIAVPNFLEAQVRSKVSRARADARTIVTAIESYAVDNNHYPIPEFHPYQIAGTLYSAAQFVPGGPHPVTGGGTAGGLSSPIAYLTSADLKDPFAVGTFDNNHNRMFYQNIIYWYDPGVLNAEYGNTLDLSAIDSSDSVYRNAYGSFKMGSVGPNKDYDGGRNQYDATNGTISYGDIYRSQRLPEGGGF